MLKSMTGYGRCETITDSCKVSVEIKSVNHRYLDLSVKMPKKFNSFETKIRNLLKQYVQRGKIDVFITYEDYKESRLTLHYNKQMATEYMNYCNKMEEDFQILNDIKVSHLIKFPEVLTMNTVSDDDDEVWEVLSQTLTKAVLEFVKSRITEGEALKADLLKKLSYMDELVSFLSSQEPVVLSEYRKRLEERVKELLSDTVIEESRILTEVTIFADKICTDEELVRLKSHMEHTKQALQKEESVGRKLDFIIQEMNREANTVLSKANDLTISETAIDLKTEIEKLREQVQNIE